LVITSCKKEKPLENDSNSKTYTGLLVANCAMTPMPNETITVFIKEPQSFGSNTLIEQYRTDATGNFNFTVDLSDGKYVNEIRLGGANITPDGPNSNTMGTIIASPTADFVVKLKINNPYSLGDTLLVPDFTQTLKVKLACPLQDTTFNPVYNYSSLTNRTLSKKNKISPNPVSYFVYNGKMNTPSFNLVKNKDIHFLISACTGMVDTVLIEIN
ncbi:MAG: hypothetical protein ABF242_05210, partial [Flavobacteriales bacterium]